MPNIYLDLRTNYATVPAGALSIGIGNSALFTTLQTIQTLTNPVVRLDLDCMDDNDNRLFGVTAQIAWVPKPSYQLTSRTPLYAVRN